MMTKLIDTYLLKSGMPKAELCSIQRSKRAFYYYGIAIFGVTALTLMALGLWRIFA